MTILAAIEHETPRGWGNTVGILCGVLVMYLIWRGDKWWSDRQGGTGGPSPAETPAPLPRETRRSLPVSSHVSPDETPDEGDTGHWYGRIVRDARGIGRRVWTQGKHIASTGNSALDNEPVDGEPVDDEIDLDLGPGVYKPAARGSAELGDDEFEVEAEPHRESRGEYIARCRSEGVKDADIARALQDHYGRSRAQAYRDLAAAAGKRAAA